MNNVELCRVYFGMIERDVFMTTNAMVVSQRNQLQIAIVKKHPHGLWLSHNVNRGGMIKMKNRLFLVFLSAPILIFGGGILGHNVSVYIGIGLGGLLLILLLIHFISGRAIVPSYEELFEKSHDDNKEK